MTMNKSSLRVVITGATSGLGREIAVQLARQGARVAVTGRRKEKLLETFGAIRQNGGECLSFQEDVTDLAAVKQAVVEARISVPPVAAWAA